MTLLSRKADYALLILSLLHQRQAGGTARAIAERFGLSRPFVANILKELCQNGFVASQRGVKGGYTLAKPAAEVTVGALLGAIDERFQLTVCSSHGHPADGAGCSVEQSCPIKGPLAEMHARIMAVLDGVTLADLFRPTDAAPLLELITLTRRDHAPATAADLTP
jgi:Rrf2 family protein